MEKKDEKNIGYFTWFDNSPAKRWVAGFIVMLSALVLITTLVGNVSGLLSDSYDSQTYTTKKAIKSEQTDFWAEHAYKATRCWFKESKQYSEGTKACTDEALLSTDVEQNQQIGANSSVSGGNAQAIREICEELILSGVQITCKNLP